MHTLPRIDRVLLCEFLNVELALCLHLVHDSADGDQQRVVSGRFEVSRGKRFETAHFDLATLSCYFCPGLVVWFLVWTWWSSSSFSLFLYLVYLVCMLKFKALPGECFLVMLQVSVSDTPPKPEFGTVNYMGGLVRFLEHRMSEAFLLRMLVPETAAFFGMLLSGRGSLLLLFVSARFFTHYRL